MRKIDVLKSIEITDKHQQIKRRLDTRRKRKSGFHQFSIQLQWQTTSPAYKVAKEISQNTGSSNSQAPSEFFLRTEKVNVCGF